MSFIEGAEGAGEATGKPESSRNPAPEGRRVADARYRAKNRESRNAYLRAWRIASRDKILAQGRARYAANREQAIATSRAWRKANRERHDANYRAYYRSLASQRRRALNLAFIDSLKVGGCVDCGIKHLGVLDFDHLKDKVIYVSQMLWGSAGSFARIETEAAKCEIRCSNCHRLKTAERRLTS